ncbi:MAG: leucine-rich repeat domain-containing protein [Acholeplasmatales bacterium]|nr:leucine-rich repeat domain-containing protein [Acholeplasmatales bacterium]
MKKKLSVILSCLLLAPVVASCGAEESSSSSSKATQSSVVEISSAASSSAKESKASSSRVSSSSRSLTPEEIYESQFEFEEIEGGYSVSLASTCRAKKLELPTTHAGKPVLVVNDLNSIYLEEVIVPEGIKELSYMSFNNCRRMHTIELPKSLEDMGLYTFNEALETVFYDGTIEDWCNISMNAYQTNPMSFATLFNIKDENGHTNYNGNKYSLLTDVVIPESITEIGNYQFYGSKCIFNLDLGNSVETIGSYAFAETTINKINIPDSVKTIKDKAFYRCTSVNELTIGSGLTELGDYTFVGCMMENVVIPDSVKVLPECIFMTSSKLKTIVLPAGLTEVQGGVNLCYSYTGGVSVLEKIYYKGTAPFESAVTVSENNNDDFNKATIYYLTANGENETQAGNWWYYGSEGAIVEKVVEYYLNYDNILNKEICVWKISINY